MPFHASGSFAFVELSERRLPPLRAVLSLDELLPMSAETRGGGSGPWILFPEIIGTSVVAVLLPLPLVHLLVSGQAFAGIAGFAVWFAALFFAVKFVRRRQYVLGLFPMLALLGLFLVIRKAFQ